MDEQESCVLDHERLDAYAVALELDRLAVRLARHAGRGCAWLGDQIQRASGSAVLNLVESVGREGADRARHLKIARGSALEVDAAITLLAHRRACSPDAVAQTRQLTVRFVRMLGGLIRKAAS